VGRDSGAIKYIIMKNKIIKKIAKNSMDLPCVTPRLSNRPKSGAGFTLVEVIVAMFIFVLVMSSSTVVFAKIFKSYGDAKDIQDSVEDAQYAMNLMAKTFRTSSVVASNPGIIIFFDHSQDKCMAYLFDDDNLNKFISSDDFDNCEIASFSGAGTVMTSGTVTGRFIATDSRPGSRVGKITVSMTITKGSSDVNLQTTTSLRDYAESEITL
jgi:prepilin-type N-terminal cleavage/methylation domain-containing protein